VSSSTSGLLISVASISIGTDCATPAVPVDGVLNNALAAETAGMPAMRPLAPSVPMPLSVRRRCWSTVGASVGPSIGASIAATAQALVAAGAKVALLARSEADISRLAQEIGDAAIAIRCDVAQANDVAAAVAQTVAHFGALDIVVNNAGLIDPVARIEDSDPAEWGRVVDVNVKGVYHVMHAAYPQTCRRSFVTRV